MRSVMFCRSCHGHAVHPTQKPVDTVLPLVEYSSRPDSVVLDMFMGSGTTGIACIQSGRRFFGIERDEKMFAIACDRFQKAFDAPVQRDLFSITD